MVKAFRITEYPAKRISSAWGRRMFRCLMVTVALLLAIPGHSAAEVHIWLSGVGATGTGSAFPATAAAVPTLQPYVGGSGTVYIWGRPDPDADIPSLENVSLNLFSDTPGTIQFTSATVYNALPPVTRFQFVDDSTANPPLPIGTNRIDGIAGYTISVSADGIGSFSDPLYRSATSSWLIAEVDYDVLATGENTTTRLYLEIGAYGINHEEDLTSECEVIFGDATDFPSLNGEDDRGEPSANYDALILPRPLPGDTDRNGAVEPADYDLWRSRFGQTTQLSADHNGNAIVDSADYVVWRKYLGTSAGAGGANAVPEPLAAVTMFIAFSALWAWRRPTVERN
jgi:hypothetical protein